ncbi:MAG: tetratricopeptide repeat protein, partial [Paracoccaceae bacterium]
MRPLFAFALALVLAAPVQAESLSLSLDQARMVAQQAHAAGDYALANALARRLLEANPKDPEALLLLAATEPQLGNPTAGRRAGRAAWGAAANAPELRYEIARYTAYAATLEGRPQLAQFWLRRASDTARSETQYNQTIADYRQVRARNPLRWGIDISVSPTSNLTGSGKGGTLEIDGQVFGGFTNQSLPPLSGVHADAQFRLSYALPATTRSQTTLGFQTYGSVNKLSSEARRLAPSVRGSDFNQYTAEASLGYDFLFPGTRHPVHTMVSVGQSWSGGEPLGPNLRFDLSTAVFTRENSQIRVQSAVERQWQDQGTVDVLKLGLMGQYQDQFGGGWGATLSVRDVQGAAKNQIYRELSGDISYALPKPIGPVSFSARLSAGIRDYPTYSFGFAQVTNGRRDNRYGLAIDMTFQDLSLWGYAPRIS